MTAPSRDIIRGSGEVMLRGPWHHLETFERDEYRWAASNAVVVVPNLEPAALVVSVELEPGPGVVERPARLIVFGLDGSRWYDGAIDSRTTIGIAIESHVPTVHALRFFVPGGGHTRGRDVRVLDFRVFRIDVAAAGAYRE